MESNPRQQSRPGAAEPGAAAESPFRAIAEFTYDWESWIGEDGRLRWLNPAVERITGYSPSECAEMPDYPLPLVHEADRPAIGDVLRQAQAGGSGNHFEFRVRRRSGSVRWAAISWQPIVGEQGESLGYRTSVRDIDERKRIEARLRAAVQRAEEANRAKTRFLANVSHELRTPLQSIVGYAELLASQSLPEASRGYVRVLLEQGQHLQHLVGDLLDLSALQASALPLRREPYRPRVLVERVVTALLPQARSKGLGLHSSVTGDGELVGDPRRIAQVLTNLIGNAIKFTAEGWVRVEAHLEPDQRALVVVVEDTGPGLPDSKAIFEPFSRGEGLAEGVGLGLAISHQLCAAMGGTLTAASRQGGGASLRAVFPGKEHARAVDHFEHDEVTALPSPRFASENPLRVLVIDDVEPAREFARAALAALGYSAVVAESADAGFAAAERVRPEVVLVDIQMPDLDGWSAARGLRARLGSRPYLVALSADSFADDASRLSEVGFDGFAQKPVGIRTLQALLLRARARRSDAQAEPHELAKSPRGSDGPLDLCELDRERWQEMAEIVVGDGETLLDRMCRQVLASLPEVMRRVRSARAEPEPALGRAVHELQGLFALIGARRAAQLAEQCQRAIDAGVGVEAALERMLVAAETVRGLLQARSEPS